MTPSQLGYIHLMSFDVLMDQVGCCLAVYKTVIVISGQIMLASLTSPMFFLFFASLFVTKGNRNDYPGPELLHKCSSRLPVNQPVDNFMATLCADGDLKAWKKEGFGYTWKSHPLMQMGVSNNKGTPNGKPYTKMDDLGVPLFSETSKWTWYMGCVDSLSNFTMIRAWTFDLIT